MAHSEDMCPKCKTSEYARVENKTVVCSLCGTFIRMVSNGS